MGIEIFQRMLEDNHGSLARDKEDRLNSVAPVSGVVSPDKYLIVRMGGDYSIETLESAALAASSDPDFVVAISVTQLRLLINREVH